MRPVLLAAALALAGCGHAAPPAAAEPLPPLRLAARPPGPPPAPAPRPIDTPRARGVHLCFRRPGNEEVRDSVDIRALLGREEGGRQVLNRIRVYSDWEERERTQAISRITSLQPDGGEEITGPAAIMLWLRDLGGIATDADREAAGLEAADAIAAEAVAHGDTAEILAHRQRLRAWLDYQDRDGTRTRREAIIVSLHGIEHDDGWELTHVEAYCQLRRAHRTFLVDRMHAIATTEAALTEMDVDTINDWLVAAPRQRRTARGKRPHG